MWELRKLVASRYILGLLEVEIFGYLTGCPPDISFPFSGCDRYLFTIRGNKYFVVVVGRGVVGRGACASKVEVCL